MIIKKKSLIVAVVSSFIISCVLVLTLAGYIIYLEWKDKELRTAYEQLMKKVNAKLYSRHIEISGLSAGIESSGGLEGRPVASGALKNKGYRDIADIVMLIRFKDKDGAILYEVVFHPQEPPLGASALSKVALPYISEPRKTPIKAGATLPFKKILTNCPGGISSELRKKEGGRDGSGSWSGTLDAEILSVSF
jgi:hypothetical protein